VSRGTFPQRYKVRVAPRFADDVSVLSVRCLRHCFLSAQLAFYPAAGGGTKCRSGSQTQYIWLSLKSLDDIERALFCYATQSKQSPAIPNQQLNVRLTDKLEELAALVRIAANLVILRLSKRRVATLDRAMTGA